MSLLFYDLDIVPLPVAAEDMPERVIIRRPLSLVREPGTDIDRPGTRTGGDDHLPDRQVYQVHGYIIRRYLFL